MTNVTRGDNGCVRNARTEELVRDALTGERAVLEAYLFGSTSRGERHAESDLDVAVYLDAAAQEPPMGHAAALTTLLTGTLARQDVDVVVLNTAPPLLYHRVLRDGIRLLARDLQATVVREGQALSRYCDYLPQLRKIEEAHAARIAAGAFGR
jgi:predicted nucleotidyltransferase